MTPEEELEYLYGVRLYVSGRIDKLRAKIKAEKRRKERENKIVSFGPYSGLYVQSNCLIPHLQRAFADGDSFISLAERAQVSDTTIRAIWNERTQWTREETAERILLALGLVNEFEELAKVRLQKNYDKTPEPPFTHYEED